MQNKYLFSFRSRKCVISSLILLCHFLVFSHSICPRMKWAESKKQQKLGDIRVSDLATIPTYHVTNLPPDGFHLGQNLFFCIPFYASLGIPFRTSAEHFIKVAVISSHLVHLRSAQVKWRPLKIFLICKQYLCRNITYYRVGSAKDNGIRWPPKGQSAMSEGRFIFQPISCIIPILIPVDRNRLRR